LQAESHKVKALSNTLLRGNDVFTDCRLPIADCRLPIADYQFSLAHIELAIANWKSAMD